LPLKNKQKKTKKHAAINCFKDCAFFRCLLSVLFLQPSDSYWPSRDCKHQPFTEKKVAFHSTLFDPGQICCYRYYLIQKAKDAKVVGIIVGTLGVGDYLSVVDRLKSVIKQAGKKVNFHQM
jgi:hypothetical protein